MQHNAEQNNARNPANPRKPANSDTPRTGIPRKYPWDPKLGVASAIGPLSQNERGGKGGRGVREKRGYAEVREMKEDSSQGMAEGRGMD